MKNSTKIWFLSAFLSITLVCLNRCTKDKTPIPIQNCEPGKVYFQNDVMPIINSNCAKSGCHDAATAQEGLNLSTYSGVMSIVKPRNPSNSKLMEVIDPSRSEEFMPPPPNTPLTSDQANIIRRWISEGALNNFCSQDTTNCNTENVSYTNDISQIIRNNCLGCHSGNTLSGGIDLSGYAGVQSAAASGKLYNSVAQNGQAVPMPPSQKLSQCDIKKIKSWVDAGSKNN